MALQASGLSQLLNQKLTAAAPPTQAAELQKFCDALAQAIVAYITQNAQVIVTGVQPGSGNAVGTLS